MIPVRRGINMRKPFDKQLFAENDARARAVVTEYITSRHSVTITPNPDQYGVDLLVTGGLKDWAIECEIKRVWSGPNFPWVTIQLPERKAKYRKKGREVEYWILNNELTHAIVIPGQNLDEHIPVEVPNVLVSRGERFYQIPVALCRKVDLSE